MLAALTAAQGGASVTLLERNPKLGRKLYITGKGRCNVTNHCSVQEALDLSAEWDSLQNGSHLTMTTIVARTGFIQENPQAVENFLADYAASVDYVNGDPAAAAELVAGYGITANAQIARAAIPKCALVCITGASDMRGAIQGYYEVLYQANPDSIGGGIPDDAFYYQG